MAFSMIPFIDERVSQPTFDWLDVCDPWTVPAPRTVIDLSDLNRMFRRMNNLTRKVGVPGGLVPREDAFEVKLNVAGFKPENLNLSLEDRTLTISGKHEEKSADGSSCSSRSFSRSFLLPQNVNIDEMKSCLAADGRTLKIEAPLLAIEEPKKEEPKEVPLQIKRVEKDETAKKSVLAA